MEEVVSKIFEKAKELYWNNSFMSSEDKEKIFYYIRGKVKGKVTKKVKGDELSNEYISNILEKQLPSKEYEELEEEGDFFEKNNPKIIAYYLPQFYPTEYNDKWWGKGATEWRNVAKGMPQYVGHYQPRLPGELGFYDLRIVENIKRQVELAKNSGIYAFCFYYYWFDGKRLLDLPVDEFFSSNVDFPFCFCWANEDWKKQWFGTSNESLIVQSKTVESYNNFISSILDYLKDERYLTVEDKKILVIYKPRAIPKPENVLKYWREVVRNEIGKELYIIASISDKYEEYQKADFLSMGFDALGEFSVAPHLEYFKNVTQDKKFVCDDFLGNIYDYEEFVLSKRYFEVNLPKTYRAIAPMWDNSARKVNKGIILDGSTPELYQKWLEDIICETQFKKKEGRIDEALIFINAWNEWSEGAYLEPDLRWGYGYLNATRRALKNTREK